MFVYSLNYRKQKQKLLYLKDIDMSISPIEKFIILTENVAKLTKIFMGKKANLVKFIWYVKYFFNVFAADLNLRKNVFQIDMPPSFLLWRISGWLKMTLVVTWIANVYIYSCLFTFPGYLLLRDLCS